MYMSRTSACGPSLSIIIPFLTRSGLRGKRGPALQVRRAPDA
jgi:hypothetical protein